MKTYAPVACYDEEYVICVVLGNDVIRDMLGVNDVLCTLEKSACLMTLSQRVPHKFSCINKR